MENFDVDTDIDIHLYDKYNNYRAAAASAGPVRDFYNPNSWAEVSFSYTDGP